MKTILHNMKSKIAATALAVLSFGAINAQTCAVSGAPTYNGNGDMSIMTQASYQGGWDSYISVDFGDGTNTYTTNATFLPATHTYMYGGTFLITTTLTAYDPNDTSIYCSAVDYDTLVINDLPVGPTSCNLQVTVGAYSTSDTTARIYTYATGSSYNYSYLLIDGQMFPGTDSMNYTFTQSGPHQLCYYASYNDSITSCSDSSCVIYTSTGGTGIQCQAAFYLWQDSSNVMGNGWLAINYSSGAGALTYAWDFGDGTSSSQAYPSHNYNTPGNYVICLSIVDANGCSSSTCDSSAALRMIQSQLSTNAIIGSLTVSAPTGITDHNSIVLSSSVAPNPMASTTKVSFEAEKSMKGKIEIVNVLGGIAFSQEINITNGANAFDINTETITNGIYFLKISSDNKTLSTIKVVK